MGQAEGVTAPPRTLTTSIFDRTTLRVVALAYRERRQAGDGDLAAFHAALLVYRQQHPDAIQDQAAEVVGQMVAVAVSADPSWFWRGVPGEG